MSYETVGENRHRSSTKYITRAFDDFHDPACSPTYILMRIWGMASMQEVPIVIRKVGFFRFFGRVYVQLAEDSVYTWGAAMAYSWLFATFPFLVFLLSLVPLVPEKFKPDVRHDVATVVNDTLPTDASSLV